MTITIETAALTAVLSFVLGFFVNLLAMRKMFVGKTEYDEYRRTQEQVQVQRAAAQKEADIQRDAAEARREATEKQVMAERDAALREFKVWVERMCEAKRDGCAPLRSAIDAIQKDIGELFKLMRESHGRLERVIGKIESLREKV